jgi:hypothetical protein
MLDIATWTPSQPSKLATRSKWARNLEKLEIQGMSTGPHLHATLSPTVKGVFSGTVLDLYKYLSEQIKIGLEKHTAPQKITKSAKSGQVSTKVDAPSKETTKVIYACPHCKKELK